MIMTTIAVVILASCRHKELCYDHPHGMEVNVVFDWSEAPDATPETMSLYLFPLEGGEPLRYEFTDCSGGIIKVPVGRYHAMCLNSSTENVSYRNMSQLKTFEVISKEAALLGELSSVVTRSETAPRAEGTEDQRVALAPNQLWSDYQESIELKEIEGQEIRLQPLLSTSKCTIEILNAENLDGVIAMSGALTGTSESLFPGHGCDVLGEAPITIPFGVTICSTEKKVMGEHFLFGHRPELGYSHMLTIYAVLSDNTQWYHTYDVTEQIRTAPDPRNIHIVLDGLSLPESEGGMGGFHPSVDDWQDTEVDIEM